MFGIYIAGAYEKAGITNFHHNIFYGYSEYAIYVDHQYNAPESGQAKGLTISHNIMDGNNGTYTAGVFNDVYLDVVMTGNILIRNNSQFLFVERTVDEAPNLIASDHNLYDSNFQKIIMDMYAADSRQYKSLVDWQNALAADSHSLGIDNPDKNSALVAYTKLFVDIEKHNYKHAPDSPTIVFMPDKSNAGPYQLGTEAIGVPDKKLFVIRRPSAPEISLIQ